MLSETTLKSIPIKTDASYHEKLSVVKHATSVYYLGTNHKIIDQLSAYFENVSKNKSLLQIFNRLQIGADELPIVILIDLPFALDELRGLFSSIQKKKPGKLLICCNEAHLHSYDVQQVKALQIIDDVFNFDDEKLPIQKRIQFLMKAARQRTCRPAQLPIRESKLPLLLKRIVDFFIAGILLLLLAPLLALIALAIGLESGGPVFYSQPRVGTGYRVFRFFKFRTMIPDADKLIEQLSADNLYGGSEKGPKFFKIENDPRITRVGKFLRNTSLDELPQLFNVLRGDMSIVGNRPLPLYEAETLTSNDCVERFCAPAGITGLWQVTKRGRPEMTVEERVRLDIKYARQVSMFFDFKILMATPKALFQKTNV